MTGKYLLPKTKIGSRGMKTEKTALFFRRVQMSPSLPNYRLSSMDDLERSLMLLQNKTRRLILERLVREPHYPCLLYTSDAADD